MQPFVPQQLPLDCLDHSKLISIVGKANSALARYDGMLESVVNPNILLSPLTTNEAVLSSKIEGTQATLDEVLEHEAGSEFDVDKDQDIREIKNYREALTIASEIVSSQPLSLNLIRQMHGVLLNSVRGENKTPGEFRNDQNWIGSPGCEMQDATYVPPSPLEMNNSLDNLVEYMRSEDVDPLIQTAIVHAQFEIIHPFRDGNGRIGRLLVPLFLYQKRVLKYPMFYVSGYLENNRDQYYDLLQGISANGQWNEWIEFFLNAVDSQARENTKRVRQTLDLYESMKGQISEITHSQYSVHLLDAIFARPIFQTSHVVERTGIAKQTLMPLLRQLKDAGLLTTIREARGRTPAILAFRQLINITEGREIL